MSRIDYLKPVKTLEFDFVFSGCPVEICNGTVYSQVEDHRLFCSVGFKNMSGKTVERLWARLWLYDSDKANLPYCKLPLVYDLTQAPEGFYAAAVGKKEKDHTAPPGKKFGEEYFFAVPESYFSRLAVMIEKIGFSDQTELIPENVTTVSYRRMDSDFDDFEKKAYERINIYRRLEKQHPAKVVPMVRENLWICCCGEKNAADAPKCACCSREKEWQLANISKEAIERDARELREEKSADMALFVKLKNRKNAKSALEEKEEDRRRREREEALRHVQEQQKAMDRKKKLCMIILAIWIFGSAIFYFVMNS